MRIRSADAPELALIGVLFRGLIVLLSNECSCEHADDDVSVIVGELDEWVGLGRVAGTFGLQPTFERF